MSGHINWNGRILEHWPQEVEVARRLLFYGDGLFETLRVVRGELPLAERHWKRLYNGLLLLGFEVPSEWDMAFFKEQLLRVAAHSGRVRFAVWRAGGGHYFAEQNHPYFLATFEPMGEEVFGWLSEGLIIGVCTSVRLPVDAYSALKSLNAPRYVAAAREAQRQGWDEALLLNAFDRVCEATSSNVFWWEGDVLCTVPLAEGCVAGVMRELTLERAAALGVAYREKPAEVEVLQQADEIFLTNAVRGIRPVRIFAGIARATERTYWLYKQVCCPLSV